MRRAWLVLAVLLVGTSLLTPAAFAWPEECLDGKGYRLPCGDHGGDQCPRGTPPSVSLRVGPLGLFSWMDNGNLCHQEVGDAVYRDLGLSEELWFYNHAALYIGCDESGIEKIIHATGTSSPELGYIALGNFDNMHDHLPQVYWGAFSSAAAGDEASRQEIVSWGWALYADPDIGYTFADCIDYNWIPSYTEPVPDWAWDGSVADIEDMRCDGVTEFSYEKSGFLAWGADFDDGEPLRYDITADATSCDEHNDGPDLSIEPKIEASPAAQHGGFLNDNTFLSPSVPASPTVTFAATGTWENGWYRSPVRVDLAASDDRSGVRAVFLKPKSAGDAVPYDIIVGSAATTFISASDSLLFFAMDNAGNYPAYAYEEEFHVDAGAPTLSVTSPIGSPYQTHLTTVTITGTATDSGPSGLYRVEASSGGTVRNYVYDPIPGDPVTGPPSGPFTIASFPLVRGLNSITLRAWDRAGNASGMTTVLVEVAPRQLSVLSSPDAGAPISGVTPDVDGLGEGTTPFYRQYLDGRMVSLQAPTSHAGKAFNHWELDGAFLSSSAMVPVAMDGDHTATACFGSGGNEYLPPTTPRGPTKGTPGDTYSYTTGGPSAPGHEGHGLEFQFDWEGGYPSGIWGGATQGHSWGVTGPHTVAVQSRCALHPAIVSPWSPYPYLTVVISAEVITTPAAPTGPGSGIRGTACSYAASAVSNVEHALQYEFDWGSGPSGVWGAASQAHTWGSPGTYQVKARARCSTHTGTVSSWSSARTVVIGDETFILPPDPPEGWNCVLPGKRYEYSTGGALTDLGHELEYQFDWGTGELSGWGGTRAGTAWEEQGRYRVRARARCVAHTAVVSDWSADIDVLVCDEEIPDPAAPTGPVEGVVTNAYHFAADTASSAGHELEYEFDWGEGPTGKWGEAEQDYSWDVSSYYQVRARARCALHPEFVSGWSELLGVIVWPEWVDRPGFVAGETAAVAGLPAEYAFFSSGNAGHPLEYSFSYDGTPDAWGSSPVRTHTWGTPGTKQLSATARCALHQVVESESAWPVAVAVSEAETVSVPAVPDGPADVSTGEAHDYATTSTSSLGHALEYEFDWGGGASGAWGSATQSHSWPSEGTYQVKERARCAVHTAAVSGWSEALAVTVSVPPEPIFADDFSDGDAEGDPEWREETGNWRVTPLWRYRSAPLKRDRAAVLDPAEPGSLLQAESGAVEVSFKLTPKAVRRPNAAVLFAYGDAGAYRYVKVKPHRLVIGQKGDLGAGEELSEAFPATFPVGAWHRLVVEFDAAGLVTVFDADAPETPLAQHAFSSAAAGGVGLQALKAKVFFDDFTLWP